MRSLVNNEKTPSLYIVDWKNKFFDFSSGLSGDSLEFLRMEARMKESDAIAHLEHIFGKPCMSRFQRVRKPRKRTRRRGK